MNLTLAPEDEEIINQKIATGRYNSPQEVVGAALRLLQEQEILRQYRLEELRHEIAAADEQAEQGQVHPFDAEEMLRRIRNRREEQDMPEAQPQRK